MRTPVTTYTFDPAAGTLTLTGMSDIRADHRRIAEIQESVERLTKMVERLAGEEEVGVTEAPGKGEACAGS